MHALSYERITLNLRNPFRLAFDPNAAATFDGMVREGAFIEHACVFGNHYGTGRAQVEAALELGQDLILEIDWQGARQVRAFMPDERSRSSASSL